MISPDEWATTNCHIVQIFITNIGKEFKKKICNLAIFFLIFWHFEKHFEKLCITGNENSEKSEITYKNVWWIYNKNFNHSTACISRKYLMKSQYLEIVPFTYLKVWNLITFLTFCRLNFKKIFCAITNFIKCTKLYLSQGLSWYFRWSIVERQETEDKNLWTLDTCTW